MRRRRDERRGRLGRLVAATILASSLPLIASGSSSAGTSQQQLNSAKAKLDQLNAQLDVLVERYDTAGVLLKQTEAQLAQARAQAELAQARAAQANAELSASAAAAYENVGSTLSAVLGATTFADLSDRLEFIGSVAQGDADLATRAQVSQRQATLAAARLSALISKRTAALNALADSKSQIQSAISQERSLIGQLTKQLAHEAAVQRAKALAAQRAAASQSQSGFGSGSGGGLPPPPSSGAGAAVHAAYSVLGVPYRWGGSDPNTGFDCSGLTMWSWAQAGVSLPHSSAMQYAVLPHVSVSDLQPGDLVFFYSPIHHVGIYVGGGVMIHAPHTGDVVSLQSLATYGTPVVGAARP